MIELENEYFYVHVSDIKGTPGGFILQECATGEKPVLSINVGTDPGPNVVNAKMTLASTSWWFSLEPALPGVAQVLALCDGIGTDKEAFFLDLFNNMEGSESWG